MDARIRRVAAHSFRSARNHVPGNSSHQRAEALSDIATGWFETLRDPLAPPEYMRFMQMMGYRAKLGDDVHVGCVRQLYEELRRAFRDDEEDIA